MKRKRAGHAYFLESVRVNEEARGSRDAEKTEKSVDGRHVRATRELRSAEEEKKWKKELVKARQSKCASESNLSILSFLARCSPCAYSHLNDGEPQAHTRDTATAVAKHKLGSGSGFLVLIINLVAVLPK